MAAKERTFQGIRYKLIQTRPYLATAITSIIPRPMPNNPSVPTCCIDKHWRLYYNPDFFNSITLEQAAAAVEHETWHVLRKHHERLPNSIKEIANIATDCEINDDLAGLPDGGWYPPMINCPNGWLAEQYYEKINQQMAAQLKNYCGSGATGGKESYEDPVSNGPGGPDGDQKDGEGSGGKDPKPGEGGVHGIDPLRAESIIKDVAQKIASSPGNVAAGHKLWAQGIIRGPKPDWRKIFSNWVRGVDATVGVDDYNFNRPTRRQEAYLPFYMPSMKTTKPDVALVLDTSGSMMGEAIQKALGQVEYLLKAMGKNVTVICCDYDSYKAQKITNLKQIVLQGGGGTDMANGIAAAEKLRCDVIVVVTDGETGWPDKRARKPVAAVIVDKRSTYYPVPDWIKRIDVDKDDKPIAA